MQSGKVPTVEHTPSDSCDDMTATEFDLVDRCLSNHSTLLKNTHELRKAVKIVHRLKNINVGKKHGKFYAFASIYGMYATEESIGIVELTNDEYKQILRFW